MGKIHDIPTMPCPEMLGSKSVGNKLARGRLIVALDALLSKRSVTLAARDLGLQTPALSRLLAQLREEFDDPLFVRTGRGLVPTPFAETLRPRVQALAMEIDALFQATTDGAPKEAPLDPGWSMPRPVPVPALEARPATLLDGQPTPAQLMAKLDRIGPDASAHERLARNIGVLGLGGGGHGRPLTTGEAEEAMGIILAGKADPAQIGALLGMIRVRGTTAPELAGFVRAMQASIRPGVGDTVRADVDWPCFASPNYHNPPWFLHAARLVSQAGYRVVLHGNTGGGNAAARFDILAAALGIPVCAGAGDIASALSREGIVYVPLADLAPQIYRLIGLHRLTLFRSAVLEAVHLLKPVPGSTSLLGVAKPSYKELHRDAAGILGWKDMVVLGSVRDVAQLNPFRPATLFRLIDGQADDLVLPARMVEPRVTPRPRSTSLEYWQGIWSGATRDARAERIIVGTAAFALSSIPGRTGAGFDDALDQAERLWLGRRKA
ncbi:glycosyl transferase family protein [Skermanella mucosa]|uniref:glycosyl transferase family protein n=1 Tax=Skermanella mucosa TaxID=1789672 RepID=UPI00192AA28D|nr:glycosyl transferase family protein [Skermanella mucosa]UEM19175.1 glycosyl transferase family protein [Skermanella mucosa]